MTHFPLLLLALLQSDAEERLEASFAAARDAVAAALAEDPAPAIGLAVRVGSAERAWAWGLADVEDRVEATPDTRFRLASVSKCLTGALAAVLWQEGRLDLDAPVQDYLPEFPRHAEGTITARLLGGHLSGIPHYGRDDRFEPGSYHGVRDGLRVFQHRPLAHPPGTQYLYSSYGFNLLGAVCEAAAQTEFRALIAARIFAPLGMRDIVAETLDGELGPAASLYRTLLGATVEVPRDEIAYKWPGGGFIAAPRDLVRFARALDSDGPLLAERARALMRTSQRTAAGAETGYSMGLNVGERLGRFALAHGGAQTGARSYLLIFPDQRIAVAVFANHSDSAAGDGRAATRAAGILLDALAPASD